MPIKQVNGTVIYMRDIAYVHDNTPQTNMVRINGLRAVILPYSRRAPSST